MYKILKTAALTMAMAMMMTVPAFAGWQNNTTGWWWQNADNTYPANKWEWLDGNGDGTAECYFFDANGYVLTNTNTPDGSQVDANGAWVSNGAVQTKIVTTGNTSTNSEYVVKRIMRRITRTVDGGFSVEAYDVTNTDMRDRNGWIDAQKKKNYESDFSFFVPNGITIPDCMVMQVELNGDSAVSVTPVWIDSLEEDYGGFGMYYKDGQYICGRREWRSYEVDDPKYALELKIKLVGEAKERAFELYPNMIVDYYVDPYEQN